MLLYSWNVNGFRAVLGKGFPDWFNKTSPDILCLQETKLQEQNLDPAIRNLPGYTSYWSYAEKKGYSGVATYCKNPPIAVRHGIGLDIFDNEGRVIETEYPFFTLLNVYFPNGQMSEDRLNYKMNFSDSVLDYADSLRKAGKRVIICGDFNTSHQEIDLKNPKANEKFSGFLPMEREWFDKLISRGYIDSFRYLYPNEVCYSWWSYRFQAREKNVGWRLDYFFVSEDLLPYVVDAFIMTEVEGSDHCPIALLLKL